MKLLKLATTLLLATASLTANAIDDHGKYSDNELIQILQQEGYSSASQAEEGIILVKINGDNYVLFNDDDVDGDLIAYYGVADIDISLADINAWNREHRLTRAYLDEENDPIVESDLLNINMTEEQVS